MNEFRKRIFGVCAHKSAGLVCGRQQGHDGYHAAHDHGQEWEWRSENSIPTPVNKEPTASVDLGLWGVLVLQYVIFSYIMLSW